MFKIPDKKSIIIFSSPRTGSHALSETLHTSLLNYKVFNEPSNQKILLNKFFIYDKTKNPYILKEHVLKFFQSYPDEFITEKHFLIRLRRKNIFDQVLSNYIARYVNNWVSFSNNIQIYEIPLDKKRLIEDYNWINMYNTETNRLPYNVNLELYFEDLTFSNTLKVQPTPKPFNYEILKSWSYDILSKKNV